MTSHSIYDSWRKGEGGLQVLFLFTVRLITTPNVLPVQISPFGGFPCDEPIKRVMVVTYSLLVFCKNTTQSNGSGSLVLTMTKYQIEDRWAQISNLGNCENDSFLARQNRNDVPEIVGLSTRITSKSVRKSRIVMGLGCGITGTPVRGWKKHLGTRLALLNAWKQDKKEKIVQSSFPGLHMQKWCSTRDDNSDFRRWHMSRRTWWIMVLNPLSSAVRAGALVPRGTTDAETSGPGGTPAAGALVVAALYSVRQIKATCLWWRQFFDFWPIL